MKKEQLRKFNGFIVYGEQKPFKRFIQSIKDKFVISNAQKVLCSKVGIEPYKTPVKRKNVLKALPVTIIAIIIPAPPITAAGLAYFAKEGLK